MMEKLETEAIAVTCQVFETMFFLTVAPQGGQYDSFQEGPSPPFSAYFQGEVGFQGRHSGKLVISIPVELARAMASNFLGLEEALASEAQAMDMVSEVSNMICGNLFSRLDKKTVWNLSIPATREVSRYALDGREVHQSLAVRFNAEGYPIQLHIQFSPEDKK